jgi:hypothetical protein
MSAHKGFVLPPVGRLAGVRGWGQTMTSDAVPRWARALTLPSVLFISALAGHTAAGGATPAAPVLVLLFVLTVAVLVPLVGTLVSPARIVALLIGGEGLLHIALELLGRSTVMSAMDDPAAMSSAASCHLMMQPTSTAPFGSVMSLMSDRHVLMLLTHVTAAAVVGMWLAAGERVFWSVLRLAARPVVEAWHTVVAVLRDAVSTKLISRPRFQLCWDLRRTVCGLLWAAGVVSRRGPPVLCCIP